MNGFVKEKNVKTAKRLTAILVAVAFVFGMMCVPAELYAAEPEPAEDAAFETAEPADEAVDTVEAEAADAEAEAAEEEAAEEAEAPEIAEPEAESSEQEETPAADLTDFVTAMDENGNSVGIENVDENAYDGFIYKMKDDTTKTEIREMETAIDDLGSEQEVEEVVSNELYTADSIETISEVAPAEQIEYIEPDYIISAMETSDTLYGTYGWYLEMINAPYVWDKGAFGNGTTVAVVDSGVKMDHVDFAGTKFVAPYNTINNTQNVSDDAGHGTAVAGIIAATYDNEEGMTGVMPKAAIMPIKVLSGLSGKSSDVIEGIDYAANHGADVINMSMGYTYNSASLKAACTRASSKGVIVVAAAGNDYSNVLEYPASYDNVVSVASIEKDGAHSNFSNYNKAVDVAAPGRNIVSPSIDEDNPNKNDCYEAKAGTSFSAPQVSAMAAMVKAIDRTVDHDGFMRVIQITSADKGTAGFDQYFGYGLMDLAKAYTYMTGGDIAMYDISLSSTSCAFNGKARTPSVTVKRANRALPAGCYRVTYDAGRTAVGTYNVYVEGINGYTGTKVLAFHVIPPLVKGIKSPKRGKKKLTVRWKSMSKKQKTKYKSAITGYQVRVSTSSKFTNAKYVQVKGLGKTQATVKGLKKKKKYYVQYRAYKTVGSATYYSKWSKTKKAKTK